MRTRRSSGCMKAKRFPLAAMAYLVIAMLTAACGDEGISSPAATVVGPTSTIGSSGSGAIHALPPDSSWIQPLHVLPGGAQIRSFDTTTCDTETTSFPSGTEVCAKATGLGGGRAGDRFDGHIRWFPPGADVNNLGEAVRTVSLSNVAGEYQDRYTPLECGVWTLKLYHADGGNEVFTWTFTVTDCAEEACSPGFWRNHPEAYTDVSFESVFSTGVVAGSWMLSDALAHSGGTSSEPNPFNANFVGTGAYLSAIDSDVDYVFTAAEVIQAVQDAHNGDPTGIDALAATFGPDHVCPLD